MKGAGTHLTVIIRDPSPVVLFQDAPTYRRVTIELTPEQQVKLNLLTTGTSGQTKIVEAVSQCFLEVLNHETQES